MEEEGEGEDTISYALFCRLHARVLAEYRCFIVEKKKQLVQDQLREEKVRRTEKQQEDFTASRYK
jgi:hypothetical protein